jgi:hypothetical protein
MEPITTDFVYSLVVVMVGWWKRIPQLKSNLHHLTQLMTFLSDLWLTLSGKQACFVLVSGLMTPVKYLKITHLGTKF